MYQALINHRIAEAKILNLLNKENIKVYLPCRFYENFI
jgi:hypothetical protein